MHRRPMAIETEIVKSLLGCLSRNTLHCRRVTSVVSMIPAVVQHEQDTTCYAPALTTVLASIPPIAQVATTSLHHSPCVDREGVEGFGQNCPSQRRRPQSHFVDVVDVEGFGQNCPSQRRTPQSHFVDVEGFGQNCPPFFFFFLQCNDDVMTRSSPPF